ncbi:MAG: TonB family protein [Desulfamplus sp.]|nr:TonB family protein [Desulfamplus sp.]
MKHIYIITSHSFVFLLYLSVAAQGEQLSRSEAKKHLQNYRRCIVQDIVPNLQALTHKKEILKLRDDGYFLLKNEEFVPTEKLKPLICKPEFGLSMFLYITKAYEIFSEVTGIRKESENNVAVEYSTKVVSTEIAKYFPLEKEETKTETRVAYFSEYDDGWRVTEPAWSMKLYDSSSLNTPYSSESLESTSEKINNEDNEARANLSNALSILKRQIASQSSKKSINTLIGEYNLELYYKIRQNWSYNPSLVVSDGKAEVRIVIKILKNGEIKDIYFETRSGNNELDESALKAVKKSNPLPPLPEGYTSYDIGLVFTPTGINGEDRETQNDSVKKDATNISKFIAQEIDTVGELINKGDYNQADKRLSALNKQYPDLSSLQYIDHAHEKIAVEYRVILDQKLNKPIAKDSFELEGIVTQKSTQEGSGDFWDFEFKAKDGNKYFFMCSASNPLRFQVDGVNIDQFQGYEKLQTTYQKVKLVIPNAQYDYVTNNCQNKHCNGICPDAILMYSSNRVKPESNQIVHIEGIPDGNKITIVSGVRIRANPQVNADELARLPIGTVIKELERSPNKVIIGQNEDYWYRVAASDTIEGWVFGSLLRSFEPAKREEIYLQIGNERLKVAETNLGEDIDLINFFKRAATQAKVPENMAEFELGYLLTLSRSLDVIQDNAQYKLELPYVKSFFECHANEIFHDEPSGSWLVKHEQFWALHKQYSSLVIGDRIAWEAGQRSFSCSDCEGSILCILENLNVGEGKYLAFYPKGKYVEKALTAIYNSLNRYLNDNHQYTPYPEESNDIRKEINKLRAVVIKTSSVNKVNILQRIDSLDISNPFNNL